MPLPLPPSPPVAAAADAAPHAPLPWPRWPTRPALPTLHHDVVVRRIGHCRFISKMSLVVVGAMT